MKTTKQILNLMLIVVFAFSINSCNCEKLDTKTITLYVDTDNITRGNLDSTCNFGQAKGVSNKDFITYVGLGEEINWVGVSSPSSETDEVYITHIIHKKGKKFFNKKELSGKKKVKGKVKDKNLKKGDSMKYSIKFTVIKKGNKPQKFTIDPRLIMKLSGSNQ